VFYLHGPLLIDVNLSELLSLVFTPGVAYAIVSQDLVSEDERDAARSADGLFARFGIGLNIRATKRFAIHPELTAIRGFQDDEALIYMAGVGFSFGSLPNFDDVEGGQPAQ
jgi:hypothetical protein